MIPRVVSHYEIVEKLGEGGMGLVYRARDTRLGRSVALKFLPPHLTASEEARRRLFEEARAISALNHPNIATLYEAGEHDGALFLVLEYLPGGTVRGRLRDLASAGMRLPVEDVIGYGLQMAEGLAHAHRRGVIHRDVKSENAMLTGEGAVKLTDFGLSKYRGGADLTRQGLVAGTVSHLAPERLQGGEADRRSDIFSLGVVLYQMATGELPFQGEFEAAVLHQIVHTPTPPATRLRPELPEAFERIVQRATAKAPEERHQSMEELISDLRSLLGSRSSGAGVQVWGDYQSPTIISPPRGTSRTLAPVLKPVRRRILLAALGVLVVLVAVLWLSGAWQRIWGLQPIPVEKQLAVLPFRNVGGDAANQAFSDGLTETLTSRLTQMEQFQGALKVVPTAEVRREAVASPGEARRLFGATLVLSGSVQRMGERVRLTVNLVDAKSLRQLRAETIDLGSGDASALQDGVVARVADLLELQLRAEARKLLSAGGTQVAASYYLYVEGVGHLARFDKPENVERAIALFQRALRQDPRHALAHAALAEAFYRRFQATKNPQWIEEAARSSSVAVELDSQLAALFVTRGMIYHGTGRYEQAVDDFQRALRLNPFNAAAHRSLAETYEAMGRVQEAETTFRQAIEMHTKDWVGYQVLGAFYIRSAAYDKAEQCYRRITELTPDNYGSFRTLGAVYYYLGRYEDAIATYEYSLKLRPVGATYSNLAAVYYLLGRYEEAARTYQKAVEMQPKSRAAWGNLGDAYLRVPGQAEKAKEAYQQAIQLAETELGVNPKLAEVRANLAVYCARLSERQRALAEIAQARKLAPANMTVLFRCALAYELVGQRALALETLKGALRGGYSLAEVETDPDLASLRRDPRFAALRKSAGVVGRGHSAR